MPDLRQTRKKLKLALAIMAGVDVLAAAIYFSPLVGSAQSRSQELLQLNTELIAKTKQNQPLQNLPQKVTLAGNQINDFYKRFPARNSEVLTEIGKLKDANGVAIEQGKYKELDETEGHVRPMEIEATLGGNYTSLAKFINAVERDQMFFVINGIALGGEAQGSVKLTVKLDAYLKAGS
jgi:type IV pilus assembly protein PilO